MKKLVKVLALFALVVVVVALSRTIFPARAADPDLCPGPGNNLIDNISPNVLVNLHKDAGSPNCWLTGTFLFRTNDFAPEKLKAFFEAAAANKILPIIRIGSENSGDNWPAISPTLAQTDATALSNALSSVSFPKSIYVEIGNEINFNNEWGGQANPESYATSYMAFVGALTSSTLRPILPPLTLNDAAAAIRAEDYYRRLKNSLDSQLKAKFNCDRYLNDSDPKNDYLYYSCLDQIPAWLRDNISGYAMNLYRADSNAIVGDKNRAVAAIQAAGFPIDGKTFLATEIGPLPAGVYAPKVGQQACKFLKAIIADDKINFLTATIFSRDSQGRVHAWYFTPSGNCGDDDNPGDVREYNVAVINLGGSTTYGTGTGYPTNNKIIYKPLGSIEQCPTTVGINTTASCLPLNAASSASCNSECSEPLEIDQGLVLSGDPGCLFGGGANCQAQIKIRGNTLPVPGQIKELADYFEGTLDTAKTDPKMLDALFKALRDGYTNPLFDEAFRKAGVARKLFPKEVQDDLRCKFLKYVKDNPDSKDRNLIIDGTRVIDIPCDPEKFDGWSKIPLFPNDDSLGKIEFVSPSLFTLAPINLSLPELQRLNLVTAEIQKLLVPTADQPEGPKTYGKEISFDLSATNVCRQTQTWDQVYGSDFQRAVTCQITPPPIIGKNNLTGCVVLPDGTISCQRGETTGEAGYRAYTGKEATVQVRTVFPHLYEISEQTISFLKGVLHIFRPQDQEGAAAVVKFSGNYAGTPAEVKNVKYELTGSSGLAINDTGHKEEGWKVFFYNLGGVINAKEFVLKLLDPKGGKVKNEGIEPPTPAPAEPAFNASKTVNPSTLPSYDGSPVTVTYTLTITPSSNEVTITSITDEKSRWKGKDKVPLGSPTTIDPATLTKNGNTFSTTYTYQISGNEFKDSTLVNVVTVVAQSTKSTDKLLLQTVEARVVIGSPALPPPPPTGKCPIAPTGTACDPATLQKYFGNDPDLAQTASRICVQESRDKDHPWGNPDVEPNDSCKRQPPHNEYSVGLFQINVFANNLCAAGTFTQPYDWRTGSGDACYRDETLLADCHRHWVSQDCDTGDGLSDCNLKQAYKMYKDRGWQPWSTAPGCGIK